MKRHRLLGIKRWRLWSFDAALRDGYRELVERDMRVMLAHAHEPEHVVLVVARGERAQQLETWLKAMGVKFQDEGSEP